jgi:acyl transferase domain-containing protein
MDVTVLPPGTNVAVFVGIMNFDYAAMQTRETADMSAHTATGSAFSICANRISFHFNFHGESVAVDTACSSSMVFFVLYTYKTRTTK